MHLQPKIHLLIVVSLVIFLVIATFAYYILSKPSHSTSLHDADLETARSNDVVRDIEKNPKYIEAHTFYDNQQYEQAFQAYVALAEQESNKELRESLYLYAAAAQLLNDPAKGVAYYQEFFSNLENIPSNRAYALLRVEQYARGVNDVSYLRPFLENTKNITDSITDKEVLWEISKQIYALHPYGITAARLARSELAVASTTAEAEVVYKKYRSSILVGREEMLRRDGLRHMAANCILNEYYLSKDFEKYGLATSSETRHLIDLAYTTGKLHSPKITQQYIALDYAEYAASVGDYTKANSILATLKSEGISTTVVNALKQKTAFTTYASLYEAAVKDARFKQYFAEFGW